MLRRCQRERRPIWASLRMLRKRQRCAEDKAQKYLKQLLRFFEDRNHRQAIMRDKNENGQTNLYAK
jgi:hypothetical protein